MGVAAPRKPSHQAVAPQQVSDTLPAPSHHQSQPFETSYTLSSVTETATISKAAPILPTKLLVTLETPTSFSAPVLAATSSPSSSHNSAIALGIVFGVFFGTIIFSFIICRFCHRGSSTPKSKSSASPRPSSSTTKAITAMPVKHSSTMRDPQRPTPVRVKSGDRKERTVPPVREAEKVHTAQVKVPVVKVIQSIVPSRPPSSQRDSSSHPGSHGAGRTHHRRDTSAPRLHPGRQAVVDVSSHAAEKDYDDHDDHDFHSNDERSRHTWNPNSTDRPHAATRERNHYQDSLYDLPPVVYVAGRVSHERRSRRGHERESQDPHEHRQTRQSRRRVRRSQPGSVNIVHETRSADIDEKISAAELRPVGQSWRRAAGTDAVIIVVFFKFIGRKGELVAATIMVTESG
ncbi:hypothetical protein QBC32DRAFT_210708 [Pseudoneurospora amorphoporcata]|uniref:Transmembrane protein n=1 Tax=Pseudoneurospora amorphoporcata TaxID=241081 RepID=A0AAN6SGW9_9PEZI|nr:hypothetical protein QBC32DRAFT_210708 [Pseudoneurospora amorphoporcata]